MSVHDSAEAAQSILLQYADDKLQDAPLKHKLLRRMIQDGQAGQADEHSHQLFQLAANNSSTVLSSHSREPFNPLSALLPEIKDVNAPTRFGDVVCLPSDAEAFVIGDIHGDLSSVQKVIRHIEQAQFIEKGAFVVFLGDYVNNGVKSWRTLCEILTFQQRYPESVILLSGNHEFKESLTTALDEYFFVHWDHFTASELPPELADRLPQHDNHYGHMRLDLIRSFGFAEGERIYHACANWGVKLPYVCLFGNVMLSHSLGKRDETPISQAELFNGKAKDAEALMSLGYEAWRAHHPSLHSAMVNNRTITAALLDEFSQLLGVDEFVVGHCHYRSGDTKRLGSNSVTTVVSSSPYSPDSGHYMYQQMVVERARKRTSEGLAEGHASAGILHLYTGENGRRFTEFIPLSSLS